MERIGSYLISVVAAALLTGIISTFLDAKKSYTAVIKAILGLFMTLTVLSPIAQIKLNDLEDYFKSITLESSLASEAGENDARVARREIIKSRCETYILDKAASLGLELSVSVTLSEDDMPVPTAIQITGNCSPYYKRVLSNYIEENLDIEEDKQIWS